MVMVRAAFTESGPPVRPGQFLSVTVFDRPPGGGEAPVYAIPSAAVARTEARTGLFVRTSQGFDFREVRILATADGQSYVSGPIEPGDQIAMTGLAALKALRAGAGETADE
jgi:cobalt-zinc-cadmium efflux system membrane fusion protein